MFLFYMRPTEMHIDFLIKMVYNIATNPVESTLREGVHFGRKLTQKASSHALHSRLTVLPGT